MTPEVSRLAIEFRNETNATINFAFDSHLLDEECRTRLDEQAKWMLEHHEVRFGVYGHTDLVGSSDYNMALGAARAHAAVDYLISKGVSADRLETMETFGENMPMVVTFEAEALNRRATTFVIGPSFGRMVQAAETSAVASQGARPVEGPVSGTQTIVDENEDNPPAAEPGDAKHGKGDNSDANGKGGNKHDRDDFDASDGHEIAEGKKNDNHGSGKPGGKHN